MDISGCQTWRMSFSFSTSRLIHAFDVGVGELLHLGAPVFCHVLANLVLLFVCLDLLHAVATHRAYRDLGALGIFVRRLHQLRSALGGELRYGYAHELSVGSRVQAETRIADCLLDRAHQATVPHLHRQHAGLRRAHGATLRERHLRAICLHLHRLEQTGMRPPGAQPVEFALQRFHRAIHPPRQVLLQLVDIGLCHDGLPGDSRLFYCSSMIRVKRPSPRTTAAKAPGAWMLNTTIGSRFSRARLIAAASITPRSLASTSK